jgi:hypothetical protein
VPRLACNLVVRNAGGEPLPGVRFVVEGASEPMPEIGYVTGADGVAHAGLPPGRAALRFFLLDGSSEVVAVKVSDEAGATYQVVVGSKAWRSDEGQIS